MYHLPVNWTTRIPSPKDPLRKRRFGVDDVVGNAGDVAVAAAVVVVLMGM